MQDAKRRLRAALPMPSYCIGIAVHVHCSANTLYSPHQLIYSNLLQHSPIQRFLETNGINLSESNKKPMQKYGVRQQSEALLRNFLLHNNLDIINITMLI